ncbi:protein kinase domain-containing protein [Sorangium atrum]|uniref:Protein kinase n=1 Tax=Sorangium atrum TaxID=2995308 RepID=A0ABT5C9C9_9BACT|nr:protein kinase [Sorangium aterium]MDC0681771.1 protein kinase [Sorangium aterium]
MLKPGDSFERYTIEAAIGQGGMGCVYRAHDARLGRRVAVKVIAGGAVDEDAGARLLREARAAAALDHPNAVSIFDVGELDGTPFIVMELVPGRTLRSAIDDAGAPASTRVAWLADVARALAAAHRRGLVHRDIKPENVMVRDDGVIKVLDFGIARRAAGNADPSASTEAPALPTLTALGVKLGTPVYMAPEQIRGAELDGRADQFAWGVLAFELLTGRLPWRGAGDVLAVVASILTDEADRALLDAAAVPPAVSAVVLRALSKRPDDRFASMDELLRALEAAGRGEAPAAAAAATSATSAQAPGAKGSEAPRGGETAAQRFSTEEVRDVLAQAIERQAAADGGDARAPRGDARLGFDDLLAAAEEVGVAPEALREASRALRARERDDVERRSSAATAAERATWLRRKRRDFYRHLGVYLIVNAVLLTLGFLLGVAFWVSIVPLLWAIGLGIHALVAFTAHEDDWAEEAEQMRWWHEQHRRRHEVAMARAIGKDWRPGAVPRQRIGAAEEGDRRGKLRVETDTARSAAEQAEEEAAVAVNKPQRRRR